MPKNEPDHRVRSREFTRASPRREPPDQCGQWRPRKMSAISLNTQVARRKGPVEQVGKPSVPAWGDARSGDAQLASPSPPRILCGRGSEVMIPCTVNWSEGRWSNFDTIEPGAKSLETA